ncbi:transposable element Tcb2 transposase [Trichonephila clavipes]|nr:transposable element Tcb2 transposase [Trichonephila clavipes]
MRVRNQRVNPTPLICSTNPTAVSLRGHRREVPPDDGQERAHSCLPSTAKLGPKGVLGPVDPRDVIYTKTILRMPSTDHARVQPTASSATIQAQVAHSVEAPESYRTIQRRLAERHLGSRCPLRVLPMTPTHRRLRLELCRAR